MVRKLLRLVLSRLILAAIVICTPLTRQYLINYARPLIYTTFMSFPALAAIKAVYHFMAQGQTEALAQDLNMLIKSLYLALQDLRSHCDASGMLENFVKIPSDCPKSPIISLLTPDPRSLAQYCQKAGFIVRAIVAPTVSAGHERVRVCLHSRNTLDQIEDFVRTVQRWIDMEKQKKPSIISDVPRACL